MTNTSHSISITDTPIFALPVAGLSCDLPAAAPLSPAFPLALSQHQLLPESSFYPSRQPVIVSAVRTPIGRAISARG
eukprot:2243401-Rhodomonas_salina.3